METFLQVIKRKGILETFQYVLDSVFKTFISKINIFWLRARGYEISSSVSLGGKNIFFQSHQKAIKVGSNCHLGLGVKLSAGFGGKININENVNVFDYTTIDVQNGLTIGENALIAPFCYITDYDHLLKEKDLPIIKQGYKSSPIIIGRNVWLGTHVVVLKGVKIGDHSMIGAGSVVTSDIPENSMAAGVPAKVIKKISR